MIYYLVSQVYHQVINSVVNEEDEIVLGSQINNRILLLQFMKMNISVLPSNMDKFLIDLSAMHDEDEKILEAINMFRMLHDNIRIIIVAPDRSEGDELLAQIFALGIWNIVATSDYLEIKEEVRYCLSGSGKSFKDAVTFKDVKKVENIASREERKQVCKVMMGVAGVQKRIGVTHNAIILAATLRKKGYFVAIVECNHSGDFQKIREDFGAKLYEKTYFTLDGIDYYPGTNTKEFLPILEKKSYNFAIYDFGEYLESDLESFHKCHGHVLVAGSKAWEIVYMTEVMKQLEEETLLQMHFVFNLTSPTYEKAIRQGLKMSNGKILNVHFQEYLCDPFNTYDFIDIDHILIDYLPNKSQKQVFEFPWFKKKKPKQVKDRVSI